MQGVTIKRNGVDYFAGMNETQLGLLAENHGVEIMVHTIRANDFVMLTPAQDEGLCEYAFVIEGKLTLECENEYIDVNCGDFIAVHGLVNTVLMKCQVPVTLLYVTSKPTYRRVKVFVSNLDELINKVDEKDKYTKMHCQHVMDLSVAISREMGCSAEMTERLAISALFHDVGKCRMPDEILQKPGKLTVDERKFIFKHPLASKQIVESNFGDDIANIVLCHHERQNGTGYPQGLSGNDIPLEAQIIAVADSFDAMTTKRPYNEPKTYRQAALELIDMKDFYCVSAAKALLELVEAGEIEKILSNSPIVYGGQNL